MKNFGYDTDVLLVILCQKLFVVVVDLFISVCFFRKQVSITVSDCSSVPTLSS